MRRLSILLVATVFLTLVAVPTANAGHIGPCWHEYIEAAAEFALDHRSFKELGSDVGGCVDSSVYWVCNGNPWFTCTLS